MTEQRPPERTGRRHLDDGTTVDLGTTYSASSPPPRLPEPAWEDTPTAESYIRTRGRWLIVLGTVVVLLTAGIALVWAGGYDQDMPLALLLPLETGGIGAIALGCMEYINRPMRRNQRLCLQRVEQLEFGLTSLVGLMDEELQQVWFRGYTTHARDIRQTGTEDARSLSRYRSGDVLKFRQRNDREH